MSAVQLLDNRERRTENVLGAGEWDSIISENLAFLLQSGASKFVTSVKYAISFNTEKCYIRNHWLKCGKN